jgi:hypothetical protein
MRVTPVTSTAWIGRGNPNLRWFVQAPTVNVWKIAADAERFDLGQLRLGQRPHHLAMAPAILPGALDHLLVLARNGNNLAGGIV